MCCLAAAALLFLCGVAAGAMSTEEIVKSAIAAGKSAKSQKNANALDDARLASRASQPNAKLNRAMTSRIISLFAKVGVCKDYANVSKFDWLQ